MDRCSVLYEQWQMECCGSPFGIGDTVAWPTVKWDSAHNSNWATGFKRLSKEAIEYCYEAHNSGCEELFQIEGIISKIIAIHSSFEPNPDGSNTNIMVPRIAASVSHADGLDEDVDGFVLDSYFVVLDNASIKNRQPPKRFERSCNK